MKLLASLALSLALLGGLAGCAKEPAAAEATKPAAAAAGKAAPAATWICPMDKDVVAAKAGTCPKCGMKLELKQ
jgi:hypothetical protein